MTKRTKLTLPPNSLNFHELLLRVNHGNQSMLFRSASTQEGRGHNPVSTSKIGIVAPAVEIVEKVNEENGDAGDADDEAQIGEEMEHPAEHPAEPAVDVPEQPEEQPEEPEEPEEPEQPEHLAEELEQPPESELANTDKAEQSPDQSEAKLDNSLEDTGTLTEDAKVEGQETSAFAAFEQI